MRQRILSSLSFYERCKVYHYIPLKNSRKLNFYFIRICGRIETIPTFQWYVEDQQPENVTIILKHFGLNDGYWEGLSFTLSGESFKKDKSNKWRDNFRVDMYRRMSSKQIGFVRQQSRKILQQLAASARERVGSLGSCGGHAVIYLFNPPVGSRAKKGKLVFRLFKQRGTSVVCLHIGGVAMIF